MKEAGLDYPCYYHIRDYHVSPERFARFMSPGGTAFMTKCWNRMPQFDGLFDSQNTVRPSYFTFKLFSRLTGERLRLTSDDPWVHGLATYDESLRVYNLLLRNFSGSPTRVYLSVENLPADTVAKRLVLDATTASNDENARLRPQGPVELKRDKAGIQVIFEPYGAMFWSFEQRR